MDGASVREPWKYYNNMAICPQNDILWPLLTAREHMTVMKNIRGVDTDIDDVLSSLGLSDVRMDCLVVDR